MLVPAEASANQRVRCRQIAESDLDELAGFLVQGFPTPRAQFWDSRARREWPPCRRSKACPASAMPWKANNGIVGVLLTDFLAAGRRR